MTDPMLFPPAWNRPASDPGSEPFRCLGCYTTYAAEELALPACIAATDWYPGRVRQIRCPDCIRRHEGGCGKCATTRVGVPVGGGVVSDNALTVLAAAVETDHTRGQNYRGLIFIRTEFLDHTRWSVHYLDVYWHAPSDTYIGVQYSEGATEMQDQDPNPQVVPVEIDPTPRFRLRKGAPQ